MFSDAYKPLVAQSVFGSSRGSKIPKTLYMTFNSTTDVPLSSRIAVANDDTMWAANSTGVVNQSPIVGVASAAWIIGSISFWTASTGGTLVCTIPLETALTVEQDADLSFAAGALTIGVQ